MMAELDAPSCRMVSGVAGVAFEDDEQRDRVVAMAIDGLRAR